jgi:hypothetical protein
MSSDMVEIHDANIVVIPEEPLKQVAIAASWVEEGEFASLMRKPLTMNQGLSFDVSLGTTTGMYQIESMRSQKVISLSSQRIEVHDRSGEGDLTKSQIPRTMALLIDALKPGRIKAIGANWEVVFKSPNALSAGAEIAEKLLRRDINFLPRNIRPIGGSARLYLSDISGTMYVLAFEPRGQNIETEELWMTCNANMSYPENFSNELLESIFQQSYNLLFEVKESLFPVP